MIKSTPLAFLLATSFLMASTNAASSLTNRHNLFDPIYAFDDIDIHTVTAGNSRPSPLPHSSPAPVDSRRPVVSAVANQRKATETQGIDTWPTFQRLPARITHTSSVESTDKLVGNSKRQIESQLDAISNKRLLQAQAQFENGKKKLETEPPKHWSALENYYKALQNQQKSLHRQQQPEPKYYPAPQQQEVDDSLSGLGHTRQPNYQINQGDALARLINSNQHHVSPKNSAFLLPTISSGPSSSSGFNDYRRVPQENPTVYTQSAPGISRNQGGIGADSILLSLQPQISDRGTKQASLPPVFLDNGNTNPPSGVGAGGFSALENFWSHQKPLPLLANIGDGRLEQTEFRKLPELLHIQQTQQRAKHQQEILGPLFDTKEANEQLREEYFCGPRNHVNIALAPSISGGSPAAKLTAGTKGSNNSYQGMTQDQLLQLQILRYLENNQDVPVTLSAGEYPSHMGVYNGTKPGEDNFICAAAWVHERFALTLASCVASFQQPNSITVQAGEWNLNRNRTNQADKRALIQRSVAKIHLFPRYSKNSTDHNLALLEFSQPIEFLDVPYICPACQPQSRAPSRIGACWTPVRSVTKVEYFDAEGEGETKEKNVSTMVELSVRLIANDHEECFRQTSKRFFNYHYPNYICAADVRTAPWRASLNQTSYFGSGIYCSDGINLNLVSIVHPIHLNESSAYGYLDLSYYRPWMRKITSTRGY